MNKKLFFTFCAIYFITGLNTYAASQPRSVAADYRVKVVQYDPNNVVVLKSCFGYQTQITFGTEEIVQSVSLGDSLAWQAVPVSNNLFIKPTSASKTNMTVLTNLYSYNFQLDSSNTDVSPTFKLQFVYPAGGFNPQSQKNAVATFDPETINWRYSFTGDRALAPIEAFDDGKFTYFKFKNDGLTQLPSIFVVDKYRNETLVNYQMKGNYMVINSVAKQFTLRDGDYVTSVYNDYAIGDWQSI